MCSRARSVNLSLPLAIVERIRVLILFSALKEHDVEHDVMSIVQRIFSRTQMLRNMQDASKPVPTAGQQSESRHCCAVASAVGDFMGKKINEIKFHSRN